MIKNSEIRFESSGDGDIRDLTSKVAEIVASCGLGNGSVNVFTPGSTAAITTIEYEPGLLQDIPRLMEKLIPSGIDYEHDKTWHDGNGFSHLRAALIGPGITVPFVSGKMTLGTWQQIVFLEFDNRPRSRSVVVQVMGE